MLLTILYNIFILPLELLVGAVFLFAQRSLNNYGVSILCVSVVVNFLSLPLYRRADSIQEQEREKQSSMDRWVRHIKKTFSGDERYMMLSAYYTEQHYHPLYVLRSSLSLLLQIPFFTAAYHYLSTLQIIKGVSFWILKDLGAPDALLSIGGISVNLLPIIMTLINLVSSVIYLRGSNVSAKIQQYALVTFFLVLLYNSPSGLVLYWIMNNLFSLFKNICFKLIPADVIRRALPFLISALGILAALFALKTNMLYNRQRVLMIFAVIILAQLPLLFSFLRRCGIDPSRSLSRLPAVSGAFLPAQFLMVLLTGILIPVSVIYSSPMEFAEVNNYADPLSFVGGTLCIAIGFFLVWLSVYYYLEADEKRRFYSYALWLISCSALVNYFVFGKNPDLLLNTLMFQKGEIDFSKQLQLVNLIVLAVLLILATILWCIGKQRILWIYGVLLFAVTVMSVYRISVTETSYSSQIALVDRSSTADDEIKPFIRLGKNGKNVIVLMLDRAISGYIPFMLEESPALRQQLDGFTYYPNALSFGPSTVPGAPPLFGGYEYTPVEMNRRSDETLADKTDEALKLLPTIFSNAGYDVAVCDPPLAGGKSPADLSIYDGIPNVSAVAATGKYLDMIGLIDPESITHKFFGYSLFEILPVALRKTFYYRGNYHMDSASSWMSQNINFMQSYSVMERLTDLTEIVDTGSHALIMQNGTAHEPCKLTGSDYVPPSDGSNPTPYGSSEERRDSDGNVLKLGGYGLASYDANMAAMLRLGSWFDHLRQNGVYDNTRIVIVSDHGEALGQFEDMILADGMDVEAVNPLLLYKDFNATGWSESEEFMTNADVPVLSLSGLIEDPVNPYTGKAIDDSEKSAHPQFVYMRESANPGAGKTFSDYDVGVYSVFDDIFKKDNWKREEGL